MNLFKIIFLKCIMLACYILNADAELQILVHACRSDVMRAKFGNLIFDDDRTLHKNDDLEIDYHFSNAACFEGPFKTQFIPTQIFDKVPSLISLMLDNVGLTELNGNDYENATSLQFLIIMRNSLPILKAHSFSSGKKIRSLVLYDNNIGSIETDAFAGLHNLQYINLDSNQITDLKLTYFTKFPKLKILEMANVGFTFSSPYNAAETAKHVGYNSSLTKLDLKYNHVNSSDIWRRLSIFPNLEFLDLSYNSITHIDDLEEVNTLLPKLSNIDLQGNPLNRNWLKNAKDYFDSKSIYFNSE